MDIINMKMIECTCKRTEVTKAKLKTFFWLAGPQGFATWLMNHKLSLTAADIAHVTHPPNNR